MLSFLPPIRSILPGWRRSFIAAPIDSFPVKPRLKATRKLQVAPVIPAVINQPKDGNQDSKDDKVWLREVKKKVLEILEKEGPMSRRKMYDEHLANIFPTAPFAPNPPPRPLWLRSQYSPQEERVYLTMSKFKRRLIRALVYDGNVSVMTVFKIRKLIAEIDETEKAPEVLSRKEKMERLVASESDKTFVWILDSWVKLLKQKSLQRTQQEAKLKGHTAPSRFKNA